jgi:gliding motility-associated-like protein
MIKKSLHIIIFAISFLALSNSAWAQKEETDYSKDSELIPNSQTPAINLCQFYVATAFTPNGDDVNDRFLVKYHDACEMAEYSIKIFDRWGRLVFESNNPNEESSWDGTNKGQNVKEGVYMWKVFSKMVDPNKGEATIINKQGTVVLIR